LKKQLQQKEMKGQQQLKKSKVVKIDSRKSWEHHITNATNKGYPVSIICFLGIHLVINQFAFVIITIGWLRLLITLLFFLLQVMVHFSAYWCMPSITMNPFFEELASTYQSVLFLNVDVDEVKVIYLYNLWWEGHPSSFGVYIKLLLLIGRTCNAI